MFIDLLVLSEIISNNIYTLGSVITACLSPNYHYLLESYLHRVRCSCTAIPAFPAVGTVFEVSHGNKAHCSGGFSLEC